MWRILRKELIPLETKPAIVTPSQKQATGLSLDFTGLLSVVLSIFLDCILDSGKSFQGTKQEFCLLSLSSARQLRVTSSSWLSQKVWLPLTLKKKKSLKLLLLLAPEHLMKLVNGNTRIQVYKDTSYRCIWYTYTTPSLKCHRQLLQTVGIEKERQIPSWNTQWTVLTLKGKYKYCHLPFTTAHPSPT